MLEDGMYYIQGNYKEVADAFNFELPNQYNVSQEKFHGQILNDMHRLPFLVQDVKEFEALQNHWLETKHDAQESYDQADPTGSPIPNHVFIQRLHHLPGIGEKIEKFLSSRQDMRFGYFDDDGKASGVYIAFSNDKDNPCWIMGILHNATAAPAERTFHLFTSIPKNWSNPVYNKEKLSLLNPTKISNKALFGSFKKTLRKALNSEKSYRMLQDMLNMNGTLKTDFFDEKNLRKRGYTKHGQHALIHPPLEKKAEETLTPSATPVKPKPNANVTEFITAPRIADKINTAVASRGYELSEDRTFLVHKKNKREIHIGRQGAMTTDTIKTDKTPDLAKTIANVLITMLRTYSVIFREGGEANFPSEKMQLTLQQYKGASETQKANFIRLTAEVQKHLIHEIEENVEDHYSEAFIQKMRFNDTPLVVNIKKRAADNIEPPAEDSEETHVAKRPRVGTGT